MNLQAGVYAASSKGPLLLTGNVILDGAGDPSSVFIFQTDSTLTTGAGSTVSLINGAQQCNIFWQIGSSATLGTGSDFTGNILASASVTVENSVTVHGRALAQTGAVTLDLDTFVAPTCDTTTPVVTIPAVTAPAAPLAGVDDTVPGGGSDTTVPGSGDSLLNDVTLPRTGRSNTTTLLLATVTVCLGATVVRVARRKPAPRS